MKVQLIILGIVLFTSLHGQPVEVKNAISDYIHQTMNDTEGGKSEKYIVFYVEFDSIDIEANEYCFKVSYMLNSFDLDRYMDGFEAYDSINGHHVWIYAQMDYQDKMKAMGFEKASFDQRIMVAQHLFPCITYSGFTYHPSFYYGCFKNNELKGRMYEDNEPLD